MRRLIRKRDAVETARRAFAPASSLVSDLHPTDAVQQALFDATQDFFLTYYSTLSAFASLLKCFAKELGSHAPHVSNTKLIKWLEPLSLFPRQAVPLLEEARRFRTLLDHKADQHPYNWGTVGVEGWIRVMLHGPANERGKIPDGALPELGGHDSLPDDDAWTFVAPDEDQVLWALAVQMNALFHRIQPHRIDEYRVQHCYWNPEPEPGDPRGGFPIFAIEPGTVTYSGPADEAPPIQNAIRPRKGSKPATIHEILGGYFPPV